MVTETKKLTSCPKCSIGSLTSRYGEDPECYACGYVELGTLPTFIGKELASVITGTGTQRYGPHVDRQRLPKWGSGTKRRPTKYS